MEKMVIKQKSSQFPRWKYDVFLSFRGEDTRKTFTSHLYEGLKNRGILTFQDGKRLEHGASISEELCKAIEESQVAVIIFSKNYASSRWCLDELVKIMECNTNQFGRQTLVIPIFYDVDPSAVRYQKESFAEAFDKHESRCKVDDVEGMRKLQRWRTALTAATNLKGYDIRQGIESDCINEIVDQISSKLCKISLSYLQDVVGINIHLEKVKSLLDLEINDVRIVGIWGMGGVGKTTITRAIFDTLSYQFGVACFLADVKENKCGMHSLQNILLSELLREKDNYVNNKEDGNHLMARRLRFKKVLVVLDDIDHKDHLDYLAGDLGWFGNGSRIIATTRDKHLVGKNDLIYEVTTIADDEAIQLFNQYAFKKEVPNEHFEKLTLEVVSHAKGLPLALKVWGSFLHKRDITEWRSAIEQMKNNSNSEIVDKLKISYDGLEPIQQEIFLDIACFLRGVRKDEIMQILESCDFGADIGLRVLIEKSLVFISEKDTIEMHDLLQDMGKYVVNTQKDPGERSRLWLAEDFEEVMINSTGTKAIEAIWILYFKKLCFNKEAMKNMKRLRILYICSVNRHDGSVEYLPNSLRWFVWKHYPWESLPENFEPKRLVHLDLWSSSLRHLWTGRKHLKYLRKLHLSVSTSLICTPDFTGMPNLEYLDLEKCSNLEEVHHSLGCSRKLIRLNLNYCRRLKKFPCVNVESLKYLYLHDCCSLEKFPEIVGRMKLELEIDMGYSGIREIPSYIQLQTHITKLNLSCLEDLVALPSCIGMLKSLVKLDVSDCPKLETLPEEIGDLENLEKLDARRTLISRPPSSIVRLDKLKFLSFGQLESEEGQVAGYFVFPPVNRGLRSLEDLDLSFCNVIDGGLPEDIGCLSSLKALYLRGNNFEHLPPSIAQLGALRSLDLTNCKRLKELPDFVGMPNLDTLNLSNCLNLEEVHHSLGFFRKLCTLELTNCKRLKRFPALCIDSLKYLCLYECSNLESFPEILGSMELEIHMLDSVTRDLDLRGLENLVTLPSSICKLKSLVNLDVSGCSKLVSFPEAIGNLQNLERLDARDTLISQPPCSIVRLNKLRFLSFAKQKSEVGLEDEVNFVFPPVAEGLHSLEILNLSYCNLIDGGLPEDIGCLSSLEVLYLRGNNFEHLPRSIAQLGALRSLYLTVCRSLTQLPELPPDLDELHADCHMVLKSIHNLATKKKKLQRLIFTPLHDKDDAYNDSIYNLFAHSLFQNIASLQHDISASDSLSQRVFTIEHPGKKIPSWFRYHGIDTSVSVNLPENWYVHDNFLGFAVCYSGSLIETTAQLIPLCNDEMSWMTQKLALCNHSKYDTESTIQLFLVTLAGLWDTSKANGKTPNDYGLIRLLFCGEMKEFGLRLLYKDETELQALLQMRENNDEPTEQCIGIRTGRYDNSEHHDSMINEASCSSCKKQRSHSTFRGRVASVFRNFTALSCKPRDLA
ncbi:PREDICTED: TMV resistance protein N-like [Nicotiana attenuata]|uniref:ADP-ribosyl cyclase/cyclic ADP-ribose hydrolase n=1 Tax=Nicotiana attenuata TaxID=49451 RepID=A0A1J6IBF7_NICAT|nr:PREDICTED: TMV resistance protein N-like [Nicotiana attenuata]XP_019247564.1 PREDICTED: TMV resistance protein N-like [Nicotiana attenuata]OIT02262.1 tmv resistance protein n [Nicotiana attenuata]